jgi:hypothetical protein
VTLPASKGEHDVTQASLTLAAILALAAMTSAAGASVRGFTGGPSYYGGGGFMW